MWGILWLLCIVATPEALVMTGTVFLAIVVSSLINTPMPTEVFVQSPEKLEIIERNSLKGATFSADGKLIYDIDSNKRPTPTHSGSSPPSE